MTDRDKINQYKMIHYAQEKMESEKQKDLFQMLRKEVNIGANGTSKYMIKKAQIKGDLYDRNSNSIVVLYK